MFFLSLVDLTVWAVAYLLVGRIRGNQRYHHLQLDHSRGRGRGAKSIFHRSVQLNKITIEFTTLICNEKKRYLSEAKSG